MDSASVDVLERTVMIDDALADRLMAMDPMAATVRDAFDHVPVSMVTVDVKSPAQMPRVAALVACAGSAGTLGWFAKPAADTGWMAEVAAYQALYVPATVAIVSDGAVQRTQLAKVSAALGSDLTVLATFQDGVTFKRAQVLGFEGQPIAQLVFQDSVGGPIALCLIGKHGAESDVTFNTMRGMASASWSADTHEVLLIGGRDKGLIERLSAQFAEAPI